jgi:hypothetical protein
VLLEFHGGGWRRGSKNQFLYQGDLIRKILDAGISVVEADNSAILGFLSRHLSNQENRL